MKKKRWTVILDTPMDVMPDEIMSTLERKLGKSVQVIEVMTKAPPIPADFTASKLSPTRG